MKKDPNDFDGCLPLISIFIIVLLGMILVLFIKIKYFLKCMSVTSHIFVYLLD